MFIKFLLGAGIGLAVAHSPSSAALMAVDGGAVPASDAVVPAFTTTSLPAPAIAADDARDDRPSIDEGSPVVLENGQVMFDDLFQSVMLEAKRPWQAPDYRSQERALGWSTSAFAVPVGMEPRVQFWLNVFTKITTDQGYLHDTLLPYIVYETVDFSDISRDATLSPRQRERRREQRIDEIRARIRDRLDRLQRTTKPDELRGDDLRYWQMFSGVDEPERFRSAQHKSRLRFQLGLKDRFVKGVYFSGRYIQDMERIFREQGLPIELTRLPFVESSFNTQARSRVGASGIWQFMRYTGREYMKINASVDERNDPLRSTLAAAQKLRRNFEMLGSWPLAVTGYNHGPSGVRRMTRKFGTSDIVELVEKRKGRFGFASANFYASFLAALIAEREASRFFGEVHWQPALQGHDLLLTKTIDRDDLLRWFRGDIRLAREFNMHLSSGVWDGHVRVSRGSFVRVPAFHRDLATADLSRLRDQPLFKSNVYRVAFGDTLESIARTHGVRLTDLLAANEGLNPRRLRPGQTIFVPQ
jgi:membrane-bound lytic murein transglycosylase D